MPDDQLETTNESLETIIPQKVEGQPVEDLSTLFTPEEVTAKKETVVLAKAEEDRRGKLTEPERTAEDKLKADAKAAKESEVVPDKYADFKIPDGMELDTDLLKEADPLFKELGLSQDKAQKVIDLYSAKIAPAFIKRQTDAWAAQQEKWRAETVANKEIKLDDKSQNLEGLRVINSLFNKEEAATFKADLDKYGLGNHPQLNFLLTRMASHLKEDTMELPGGKGIKGKTFDETASRFYG